MTFEVPASKASKGQDQFEFKIGADTFRVKKLKFLPIGQAEDIEASGEALFEFFAKRGTKQGDAVRSLDRDQWQALVAGWQADSDVQLGESEASSTS